MQPWYCWKKLSKWIQFCWRKFHSIFWLPGSGWLVGQMLYLLIIVTILMWAILLLTTASSNPTRANLHQVTLQGSSLQIRTKLKKSGSPLQFQKLDLVLNVQGATRRPNLNSPFKNPYRGPPKNSTSLEPRETKRYVLLILVHSARGNLLERKIIRNTYGTIKKYQNWDVKLVFLIGKKSEDSQEKDTPFLHIHLAWEIEAHSDIIMGNFLDTYRNLVYKHIMGYRWTVWFFPQANYIVKVNDNIFVDIFEILDHAIPRMYKEKASLYCTLQENETPNRNPGSMLYASVEEFPDDYYPPHCPGSGYIITMNGIRKLYAMVQKIPVLMVDDAYATGMLREAYLGINPNYTFTVLEPEDVFHLAEDSCDYSKTQVNDTRHLAFYFNDRRENLIDEAWCYWKFALERRNLLKSQSDRFRLSVDAM